MTKQLGSMEVTRRFERYRRRITIKKLLSMLGMFLSDRRMRQIVKDGAGAVSKDLIDVVGYGVDAGRKA